MNGDSPCVENTASDLDSSKVYTYCGNCKGVRDLIDKHNALKRCYDSCLRLNEILVQKTSILERQFEQQQKVFTPPEPWDELKERARFYEYLDQISKAVPKRGSFMT